MTDANDKIKVRSFMRVAGRRNNRLRRAWRSFCPRCGTYNIAPTFALAVKRNEIHILNHQLAGK